MKVDLSRSPPRHPYAYLRKCKQWRWRTFICYPPREIKFHYYFSDFVSVPVMYKCIKFSYSYK